MAAPASLVSRAVCVGWAAALAGLLVPETAVAQTDAAAGAAVEVRSVKFAMVRPELGGDAWLETQVEVNVIPDPGAGVYGRFADRVQATLLLSVRKRDNDLAFFRASAEAVSLEAGRAMFRFYLPPEILRREQINTDPHAYAVELAVGGRVQPITPSAVSSELRTGDPQRAAALIRTFKDRVAQAAPRNDGVLVPQYLSPFAGMYRGDTPSFVRRAP